MSGAIFMKFGRAPQMLMTFMQPLSNSLDGSAVGRRRQVNRGAVRQVNFSHIGCASVGDTQQF
jgi:hypothetical protein